MEGVWLRLGLRLVFQGDKLQLEVLLLSCTFSFLAWVALFLDCLTTEKCQACVVRVFPYWFLAGGGGIDFGIDF